MGTPKKEHLRELPETERAALQRIVRASSEEWIAYAGRTLYRFFAAIIAG